jgi:hypothetical protein
MKLVKQTPTDMILAALALLVFITCTPTKAYGYADPGTGTFVYQAVYAAFIGGAFYFRKLIQRLRGKSSNQNQ